MSSPTADRKTRWLVFLAVTSALLSAIGTYLYFFSVLLMPLFLLILWLVFRWYKRLPEPRTKAERASAGFAVAAVAVPPIALAGLLSEWWEPFISPGWTTHPMTFILAPALLALVMAPLIGIRVGGRRAGVASDLETHSRHL